MTPDPAFARRIVAFLEELGIKVVLGRLSVPWSTMNA